jgi:hypothetical protein
MTLRSRAAAAAASLPPWLGLVIALASLAVFHALASMAPPAAIGPERLRSVAVWALVSDLSGGFQWGFPVIFLTWTVASMWTRRARAVKSPGR